VFGSKPKQTPCAQVVLFARLYVVDNVALPKKKKRENVSDAVR